MTGVERESRNALQQDSKIVFKRQKYSDSIF